MKTDHPVTCLNCGHIFTGEFCNQCGEKVYAEHDKSFKHFLHESFHFLTHLDGKFLKSLKLIFFKPGQLAFDYCRGIRKRYFKPVSLFLIGVILYLIFPLIQGLNTTHQISVQTFHELRIDWPVHLTRYKMEKQHITWPEVSRKYDAVSPKVAKIMLLILLPVTGCILWLLFFRRRGYMFDHLILGTEMNTLFVYVVFLLMPLSLEVITWLWHKITGNEIHYGDSIMAPIQIVVLGIAWAISLRRFYQIGRWESVWKTVIFFFLHAVFVYVIYRLILFFVVMAII